MPTDHVQNRTILSGLSNARKSFQKLIQWFSGGVSTGPAGSVTKVQLGTNLTGTQVGDTLTIDASGGAGTVSSVAVSTGSSGVSVTGSPVTTTGTIDLDLGTMANVDDAPSDGSTYGRNNGAWVAAGGGGDGTIYADFDATPAELESAYSRPITIPYDWTIDGWRVIGAESEMGTAVLDVLRKTTLAGAATSVVGTTPPSVTGANAAEGSDMAGWTTGGNAGDLIVFHLSSVAAFTALRAELTVTKS